MGMHSKIVINKPIQEVWDYVNNPDNLTKWIESLVAYERISGDPSNPQAGDKSRHTYNERGRDFSMDEEIISIDPPRSIQLMMTSKSFDMEISNKLKEVDNSSTELTATADFTRLSLMMRLIMFFSPKAKMQQSHRDQLAKLKGLIEEI